MKKLLLMVPFLAVVMMQFASPPAWSHGYGWYARRGIPYNGGYHHGYGGYGGYGGGYNPGYSGYNNYNRGYGGYGGYGGGYGGYGGGFAGGLSRLIRGY